MDEVPQAGMHLQPFTVGTKVAFISWSFADSLVGAGAALWSLEGSVGDVACVCNPIMVPTRYAPRRSPVGVGVDLLALCCRDQDYLNDAWYVAAFCSPPHNRMAAAYCSPTNDRVKQVQHRTAWQD